MLASRTIYVATDHAGFHHKEAVRTWLLGEGLTVVDVGATILDPDDDFPDYISLAAKAVSLNPETAAAVIFGGSGQGEAMLANRFSGVRATVYYGGDESIIQLSREHNDANILSLGARFVAIDQAKKIIWDWLHFDKGSDPKYHRRNVKIDVR